MLRSEGLEASGFKPSMHGAGKQSVGFAAVDLQVSRILGRFEV